jgi:hypothetical protein
MIHAHICIGNLNTQLFNPDMMITIEELLAGEHEDVKWQALETLSAAMDHSKTSA